MDRITLKKSPFAHVCLAVPDREQQQQQKILFYGKCGFLGSL